MKRGLLFLLLLAVIALCAFSQNAKRITGVIRELTGEVELKRSETSAFIKAKAGDSVVADTVVSTGFKSTAIIEIGSSSITVRPLTRLTLAEIQSISDTETLNMKLQTGRVKVDVKPPAGTKTSCTVQSPNSTASVRGTSFEFDTFNLKVYEGGVAFNGNRGKSVLVPAGLASSIDAENKAIDPFADDIPLTRKSLRGQPPSSNNSNSIDITITW